MNSSQLTHRWAQQTKPHGKSGNVRFNGASLYYYQAEIARFFDARTKDDRRVVVISQNTYSHLTTQQQQRAWHATSHYYQIGYNHFTGELPKSWERARHIILADKLSDLVEALAELNGKTRNVIDRIDRIGTRANWLITFLGNFFKRKEYPKDAPISHARLVELSQGRNRCQNVIARYYCSNIVDKIGREQARTAKLSEFRARQIAEAVDRERQRVEIWRNGGPSDYFYHLPVMLRVRETANEIETSKGARVPIAAALLLYRVIQEAPRQVSGFKIGDFTARDIIGTNGDRVLRIGCHDIPMSEVERVYRELQN